MSGLYQRALDFLESQRQLRLVRSGDDEYERFDGTPEERAQIEREIRRAVEENRGPADPDSLRVVPMRRSSSMPIAVNLIAVVLIVVGVLVLTRLFDREEQTLLARASSLASAEGRLLSALREESEAQLSQKEREIADAMRRLEQLEIEREQIRFEAEARLEALERELSAGLERALEAERGRLEAQDLTEAQRSDLLATFRREREGEFDAQVAELQRESQAQIAAREASLAAISEEYEAILHEAEAERDVIEARYRAELQRRDAQLSDERVAAEGMLADLRAQQAQRQLMLDQILGFYARVRDALGAGQYDSASADLASLREYLDEGPIAASPELQRRRAIELFLVETLEDRIARVRSAGSAETRTLVESAALIARVGELLSRADAAREAGDIARARGLYLQALAEIPAVDRSYRGVAEIDEQLATAESRRVSSLIADGNALYRGGDTEGAIARYEQALATLPSPDDQLLARLLDAGYELLASDTIAEREGEINALRARLAEEQLRAGELGMRLSDAQAAAGLAASRLAASETEITSMESRLTSMDAELVAQEAQLAGQETALAGQQTARAARETELAAALEALGAARADAQAAAAQATASAAARADAQAAAAARIASTEELLAGLRESLAQTEGELDATRVQVRRLTERLDEQSNLAFRVRAYRAAFESRARLTADTDPVAPLELLETKLLILRIVGSQAIRADYPDLYEELNDFLDALVEEQRTSSARLVLRELGGLFADLTARIDRSASTARELAASYPTLSDPQLAEATADLLSLLASLTTAEAR